MLRFIYNLLFPLAFAVLLPTYLRRMFRRGNFRRHFGQRFGIYTPEISRCLAAHPHNIWLQAVSVGEMLVALKLVTELRAQSPGLPIVLSTTTTTGHALAAAKAPADVVVVYTPIDLKGAVTRAFYAINPRQLVIVDGGLWPNQLWEARERKVPTALVNARLSPRSESRFRKFPRLAEALYGQLDQVCATEQADLQRWRGLGVALNALHYTGSIKFDDSAPNRASQTQESKRAWLESLGVRPEAPILLAGSTHPPEERTLAEIFQSLRRRFPGLFLVVAPRHVERAADVRKDLTSLGLRVVLRSELTLDSHSLDCADVLLIDTTGELRDWYSVATLVFIGKSLYGVGGQNPAEAIMAGVPVVVGPHMENFCELIAQLLAAEAVVQVDSAKALEAHCTDLLADSAERVRLVTAARDVLVSHRGATARTANLLLEQLQDSAC